MSLIRDDDPPRTVALMLVCFACVVSLAVALEAPVTVTVEGGHFHMEPAWIRLRVRVEPARENVALQVVLDSDGYVRSSTEDLAPTPDGRLPPRTRWMEFRDVPSGVYRVTALVERPRDKAWRASTAFEVRSRVGAR